MECQQIEAGRFRAGEDRKAGMGLAAMMRLVVEKMRKNVLQRLIEDGAGGDQKFDEGEFFGGHYWGVMPRVNMKWISCWPKISS